MTQGCRQRRGRGPLLRAEAGKVIQAYVHAVALTGRSLGDVLRWVANPMSTAGPTGVPALTSPRRTVLARPDPRNLDGDDRRAGNTITTVQQPMSLVLPEGHPPAAASPDPAGPRTDIAEVIRRCGTVYMLGRDDPYASASPLMTAIAEHVLDIALATANHSPWSSPRVGASNHAG